MQLIHNPLVNLRYWVLISLASIFGTNTGDLAVRLFHQFGGASQVDWLGLKHIGPLPILILAFVLLCLVEKIDKFRHEIYFWSAIIIIRTAATNIADALAGDLNLNFFMLTGVFALALLLYALQWQSKRQGPLYFGFIPESNLSYWFAMLLAGVLGTIVGDALWHEFGITNSAAVLTLLMALLVYFGYRSFLVNSAAYWFGIVAARIAGTAVGDWLAKSAAKGGSGLDLETATLVSASLFVFAAVLWSPRRTEPLIVRT